jgi:hypothetical protein
MRSDAVWLLLEPTCPLRVQCTKISELGITLAVTNNLLLVIDNFGPSSLIRFETSVLTRATRRHSPEDGILHSHCRGNLKSYIALTGWTL